MNSESTIHSADFFLREIPDVKIGNKKPDLPNKITKEELQFLRVTESAKENILDTLRFIYGNDLKFKSITDYEDVQSNLARKFWVGQGSLVVKGGCDYSISEDRSDESERIKQFALYRLESYGFHQSHCMEAFNHCSGQIEDALCLLYSKYFNTFYSCDRKDLDLTARELLEQRQDERSSLESIYEKIFHEKIKDHVWILKLKLDYLTNLFHNKNLAKPAKKENTNGKKKEKCKNIIRTGHCKYGAKCRFSHEFEPETVNLNSHLEDFIFEMEIRFPPESKYPFEPPMIFLRTNAVLPPLVKLHICKRLLQEASTLAEDGIPCVYTITELLQNEESIISFLAESDLDFIKPNVSLFKKEIISAPATRNFSHYKRGRTNRDNKKVLRAEEIARIDQNVVRNFLRKIENPNYLKMLQSRQSLPAFGFMQNILKTLEDCQVVVISGETGCGKSTQVPQFILDDWMVNYAKGSKKHVEIVCTQPRRISAIGVAERVAEERVENVGNTVGYQIRLENKISDNTRLTFCTTGILLRRLETEPMLSSVTHIIVDEVHERSEQSDFLLLILRNLLKNRSDLKVILMSATLNANIFSDYFDEIPTVSIPGRTFPVVQYFLEDIFQETEYVLEEGSEYCRKIKDKSDFFNDQFLEGEDVLQNMAPPRDSVKDENLNFKQIAARYAGFSKLTCKNLYFTDVEKINYDLIEHLLLWIVSGNHNYPKEGTILIFLPGIAEITSLYDQLTTHAELGTRSKRFLILPLHSSLSNEEQAAIFKKPKYNMRKIVLSTNLAETSITINDCVYVIDAGRMKETHFDPNRNMESLETVWVTRANALQRKGRAGRVMSGVSFHLYSSNRFKHHMLPQPIPEIQRIPLEQLILNIKILQNFEDQDVKSVLGEFIEPPTEENIDSAIRRLQSVGALDQDAELTALGHHLASLPVDVRIGKLLLYGAMFSCVDAALTMAACLSYKNPFVTPFGKKDQANAKKMDFAVGFSDQITVLVAYRKWLATYKKSSLAGRNFANENFLSFRTLVTIVDIKYQFLELLVDIGFISVDLVGQKRMRDDNILGITGSEFNKNDTNMRLLSSVLCAALYPNVIKVLTPSKSYIMSSVGAVPKELESKDLKFTTVNERIFMHPSSINYTKTNFPSPFLVYQEKIQTSKIFFRDCSMVPLFSLIFFSGYELDIRVNNGTTFISLENGWILFQVDEHENAEMIKMIRNELVTLLEEKIKDPLLNLVHNERGNRVVQTILNLISM